MPWGYITARPAHSWRYAWTLNEAEGEQYGLGLSQKPSGSIAKHRSIVIIEKQRIFCQREEASTAHHLVDTSSLRLATAKVCEDFPRLKT